MNIFNKLKELNPNEALSWGFLLGAIVTLILLFFVAPNANSPVIEQIEVHDTIYLSSYKGTYYNPVSNQTDNTPTVTSVGHKIKKGDRIVALSRDLFYLFPYHSEIEVVYPKHLAGMWQIKDCMNKRHKKTIDFCSFTKIKVDKVILKL